jgi:hypothetical protein
MTIVSRLFLLLLLPLLAAGCGKSPQASGGGGHGHTAPHGGKLVELGQHAYNVELVRDATAGKLTAYVLDGHAESFIRIEAPSLAFVFTVNGETKGLLMRAVASQATGETVGNSSQFEADAEWLKGTGDLSGVIKTLPIRGTTFSDVAFRLP